MHIKKELLYVLLLPLAAVIVNATTITESDYGYKYNYTVGSATTPVSSQTDFQVAVQLDTATLISAGKMLSNCADIRVTNSSGEILPHWIQDATRTCNMINTTIWFKAYTLPANTSTTFYVYYNNKTTAAGTNISYGDGVFLFFDDFNDNSRNATKWTAIVSAGTETGGKMVQTYAGAQYGESSPQTIALPYKCSAYAYQPSAVNKGWTFPQAYGGIPSGMYSDTGGGEFAANTIYSRRHTVTNSSAFTFTTDQYYMHEVGFTSVQPTTYVYIDGVNKVNGSVAPAANGGCGLDVGGIAASGITTDFIFARKFLVNEPTVVNGSETAIGGGTVTSCVQSLGTDSYFIPNNCTAFTTCMTVLGNAYYRPSTCQTRPT